MTATVLGPKEKKWGATHSKKKKKNKENSQSKNRKSFLLNKIMIHHIQNSRGRLVLKITTEQPRNACFKDNYRTAEEDFFKVNYRTAKAGLLQG